MTRRFAHASSVVPRAFLSISIWRSSSFETLLVKGEAPSRGAFGSNPEEVIQRFLQYLGADEKRDLLLASYLERVHEELFQQLA